MPAEKTSTEKISTEDRLSKTFDRVASTTERVGIPIATFAIGAITLGMSYSRNLSLLAWLGTGLIVLAFASYVWFTTRSSIRLPAPLPLELKEQINWMRQEISVQNKWLRREVDDLKAMKSANEAG